MAETAAPLLAIAGTGTEVGKTWFAVALAAEAGRRGLTVAARKPAQSFVSGEEGATDADQLAAATAVEPFEVCPPHRWYPTPMAPVMAAQVLARPPFTIADLAAELDWFRADRLAVDLRLLETAGGLRSPLADDGDSLDLIRAAGPTEVIVVADAGLGTLHECRAAAEVLRAVGLDLNLAIVLNRYDDTDDLHRRNRAWLQDREGLSADPPNEVVDSMLARLATSGPGSR